jgi:hypothetical protein
MPHSSRWHEGQMPPSSGAKERSHCSQRGAMDMKGRALQIENRDAGAETPP